MTSERKRGRECAGQRRYYPALRLMRDWRVMLAMTRDEPKNKAHHEYNSIQTVSRLQCRQRAAVRHNRTGDHEGEHCTDGATGQNEVNQFWGGDLRLL